MVGIIRDIVRAALVVLVLVVGCEVVSQYKAKEVVVQPPPTPQPVPWNQQAPIVVTVPQQHDRPIRRVGSALVELAESMIGVVR